MFKKACMHVQLRLTNVLAQLNPLVMIGLGSLQVQVAPVAVTAPSNSPLINTHKNNTHHTPHTTYNTHPVGNNRVGVLVGPGGTSGGENLRVGEGACQESGSIPGRRHIGD